MNRKIILSIVFVLALVPSFALAATREVAWGSGWPSSGFSFNAADVNAAGIAPTDNITFITYAGTYPDTSTQTFNTGPIFLTTILLGPNYVVGGPMSDYSTDGVGNYYGEYVSNTNGNTAVAAWYWDGSTATAIPNGVATTRIISVTPYDGQTVATSTTVTFGATGYISGSDFADGMFLEIRYANYAKANIPAGPASPDTLFTTIDFPITSAGPFDLSTTSPATFGGQYTMQTQIKSGSILNSALNFLGFGQFATFGIQTATSTNFVAGAFNGYDTFNASTTEAINNYLASSTISLAACTAWTSFNLGDCLNLMLVPQTQPLVAALANFRDGFLSAIPWGYVTRALVIFSGGTKAALPVIHIQVPLGDPDSPQYTDGYFTLDVGDMLSGGAALLDTVHTTFGEDESFRTATEPFVQLSIYMALVLYIIRDLLKMRHHGGGGKLS